MKTVSSAPAVAPAAPTDALRPAALPDSPLPDVLPRAWYARDARIVARALLGCLVVRDFPDGGSRVARIVETEAYRGATDLACHARAGLTKRTRSLLGPEGHAYVFLVYGMHDCFNVTCRREGAGHAVLIRAAEPLAGFAPDAKLNGPGRFARAMGITRLLDGHDLTAPPLTLRAATQRPRIVVTARVGVAYAGEWADEPWRFYDATSAHVSKPPRGSIGRRSAAGASRARRNSRNVR